MIFRGEGRLRIERSGVQCRDHFHSHLPHLRQVQQRISESVHDYVVYCCSEPSFFLAAENTAKRSARLVSLVYRSRYPEEVRGRVHVSHTGVGAFNVRWHVV